MSASEPCPLGNGIFGCGDRATEIAARDEGRPQRPKGLEIGRGNPGKNSLSELDGKISGLEGLGGGGYSLRKPVSGEEKQEKTGLHQKLDQNTETCTPETQH